MKCTCSRQKRGPEPSASWSPESQGGTHKATCPLDACTEAASMGAVNSAQRALRPLPAAPAPSWATKLTHASPQPCPWYGHVARTPKKAAAHFSGAQGGSAGGCR